MTCAVSALDESAFGGCEGQSQLTCVSFAIGRASRAASLRSREAIHFKGTNGHSSSLLRLAHSEQSNCLLATRKSAPPMP